MRLPSALRVVLAVFVLAAPAAHAQHAVALPAPPPAPSIVGTVGGLGPLGLLGEASTNLFGRAVADAGDVNGDGYGDLVVGASFNSAAGSLAGRAYVYFGGAAMDDEPDVVLTGAAAGDQFGGSVSGAGDVNGDGFADVIVGAAGNDAGGSDAGRAYVYFGGSAMDTGADVTLTGSASADSFGTAVAGTGDVNGDGFADVVVGAPYNDAGGVERGRAYVYFGGAAMNAGADVILKGVAVGDRLGSAVAGAGDVNGDGFDDVVAGAPYHDTGGSNAGRAYVYFGGAAMDAGADETLTGVGVNDLFGASVAGAGDVDGDGFDDIVAGAYANDAGGTDAGRAYVYLGGAPMNAVADVTLTGPSANIVFGFAVAGAGDVDGDGYYDVIVGAYGDSSGGSSAGRAYVYLGGAVMDASPDVTLTGAGTNDNFGFAVAGGGDVNGDGRPEVVVGAPGHAFQRGRAQVYSVRLTGEDLPDELFTGGAVGDHFGHDVAGAGDVNGDGYDDVIVGAPYNDAGGTNAGRATIYFGGPLTNAVADVTITNGVAVDFFGWSVAGAGDVNGDGYDDVIVGAIYNGAGGTQAGRAYICFGGAAMDDSCDVVLTGTAGEQLGFATAGAGDVNGDGYDDVIVGAPYNGVSGTGTGRALVYFGGAAMDNVYDVWLPGSSGTNGFSGSSVAGAGDVNGDGYDDVVVGSPGSDAGGTDSGLARVYFGGAAMNTVPDVTMTGVAASDNSGVSVTGAGDVNGDGYADVAVGANGNDAGGASAGSVTVYFGGLLMNGVADVTLYGAQGDGLGASVTGAGDVNGDGYDDVAAAAPSNDTGGTDAGRAYVFFGGVAMDATPDVTMTGAAPNDFFGFSIGATGEAGVLVGASGVFGGETMAGRAYLYRPTSPSVHPRIAAVRDVPDDQGGFVTAEWTASAYDARGTNRVTQYVVERSRPPAGGGFAWEPVATIPASHNVRYSAVVATYGAVPEGTSGPVFVRVTARTAHPDEYWRSAVESGASVDNLAPPAPLALSVAPAGAHVQLGWTAPAAPDLDGYAVYRSATTGFTPDATTLVATVGGETWTDASASPDEAWFYRVAARDVNGNEGEASAEAGTTTTASEGTGLPTAFALTGASPNPVRETTEVRYALPEAADVTLVVYDVLGREVGRLVDGARPAGYHTAAWRVGALAAGSYVVRFRAGDFVATRALTVVR